MDRQLALVASSITVSLAAAALGFYVSRVKGLQGYAYISLLWLLWASYLIYKLLKGKRK